MRFNPTIKEAIDAIVPTWKVGAEELGDYSDIKLIDCMAWLWPENRDLQDKGQDYILAHGDMICLFNNEKGERVFWIDDSYGAQNNPELDWYIVSHDRLLPVQWNNPYAPIGQRIFFELSPIVLKSSLEQKVAHIISNELDGIFGSSCILQLLNFNIVTNNITVDFKFVAAEQSKEIWSSLHSHRGWALFTIYDGENPLLYSSINYRKVNY